MSTERPQSPASRLLQGNGEDQKFTVCLSICAAGVSAGLTIA
jgi:hypothetical protein